MKKNQQGFSIVEILVLLLCVGILGLAGWFVWSRSNPPVNVSSSQPLPKSSTNVEDATFFVAIDPMVGGGFVGAVNGYEITAIGEVFNLSAPDSNTEVKKSLLKKVTLEEVAELRQSFIESGVLDIAPGDNPKYSGSAWKVTINGKEQLFYDQTSPKFDIVKIKLKKILGEDVRI
jgi:hypothetical protein